MALWSSTEVEQATSGSSTCAWVANGVSIDTRTIRKGDLFIALKDKRDGHSFVADALSKGASAAMVSFIPRDVEKKAPLIIVKDTQSALQRLGAAARNRSQAQIIAVTGSVGKTSTKEMLRTVLARQGYTHASVGSYNNHWGVPLTLSRMPKETQFGIFEIGMNHPNEIAPLSRLVQPHVVLITAIAEAHLEAFESIIDIAIEKASVMEGLVEGGFAILNADTRLSYILKNVANQIGCGQVWFGKTAKAVRLINYRRKKGSIIIKGNFNGKILSFSLETLGEHFVFNALATVAAVQALGGHAKNAAADLALWTPEKGRCSIKEITTSFGKIKIIDDTYNANPASMTAALDMLGQVKNARRVAILGDMLELGTTSEMLHASLSKHPSLKILDKIHTVGMHMRALHANLPTLQRGMHFSQAQDLLPYLQELIQKDDCILVKASNGIGLSLIIKTLVALEKTLEKPACEDT